MAEQQLRKNDFSGLKRKIFRRVILIGVIAVVVGWLIVRLFIDGIFQVPFANTFMRLATSILNLEYVDALEFYQRVIRNFKSQYLIVGFFFLMLAVFYWALARFTKYFDETSAGIDSIILDEKEEIHLSPELNFMEQKLNTLQHTLAERERNANEAEQRKNDLVVYLAHDIKTPLTSVIGYLSLLAEAPDMPAEQRAKYTGITLEKAYRLEQLINEFFEITRFNLQKIILEKEDIDLYYMLVQMTEEFYPLLTPERKQTVIRADESLTIYGDANKLARVFNNILKNAVAYSEPGGLIEISAEVEADWVRICFANQGKTIPAEQLTRIFEKFYRLDEARSSNTGGAGLGLAIAKEIITLHGGKIRAESENGRTLFTVLLPLTY